MRLPNSLRGLLRTWDRFWFTPATKLSLHRVCRAFAILTAILLVSDIFWVPQWLSDDGWYGINAGRYFIGDGRPDTGSQYRWSILYLLGLPWVSQGICVVGAIASVLLFFGLAGRWASLIAWACLMMIHHRAPWLSVPGEVLSIAGLAYLSLDSGRSTAFWKPAKAQELERTQSVLANISLRCLQIHWFLWVGLSLANMLQNSTWWDGSALEVLGQQGTSWFGKLPLGSWTSQIVGFLVILLHVASAVCLSNRSLRSLGVLLTFLLGTSYVLLTADWILGLAAVCYALAFVPYSEPEKI